MYTLIYLLKGTLPWLKIAKHKSKEILSLKAELTPDDLCQGSSSFLKPIMNHLYELTYEERPDYDFILRAFEAILCQHLKVKNMRFDW